MKRIRTKGGLKPWITNDIKELMGERDYALKIAKRSGQNWDNYGNLKNFTNRKIKVAEAKYYKDLIESLLGPREMWSSLSSVIINGKKTGDTLIQIQDGKIILCEPKAVASKFNKFFATIGSKISSRLRAVATDACMVKI